MIPSLCHGAWGWHNLHCSPCRSGCLGTQSLCRRPTGSLTVPFVSTLPLFIQICGAVFVPTWLPETGLISKLSELRWTTTLPTAVVNSAWHGSGGYGASKTPRKQTGNYWKLIFLSPTKQVTRNEYRMVSLHPTWIFNSWISGAQKSFETLWASPVPGQAKNQTCTHRQSQCLRAKSLKLHEELIRLAGDTVSVCYLMLSSTSWQ